jgi:hypothetical protein
MSPDLFGFRTAGSAWSGSSPALCVSAIHGRQRNLRQRGSSRQAWRGPFWLRSLAWQARHRLRGSVGLAWQATHGTASSFGARQATLGAIGANRHTHGRSGMVSHVEDRQATQRSAGTPTHGRFGLFRPGTAGTIRHGIPGTSRQARRGQTYKVWPGFSSQGRQGVASPGYAGPDSMASQGQQVPAGTVQRGSASRPMAGTFTGIMGLYGAPFIPERING